MARESAAVTILGGSGGLATASGPTGSRMAGDIVQRIVEQNLGVYRAASSRLQEDVSQEAQVASDYRGRLVYELLQNADDAMEGQSTNRDRVDFVVTDDALWMANSGRPLTDADVQGLCGLGASSKVGFGRNQAGIDRPQGPRLQECSRDHGRPCRVLANALIPAWCERSAASCRGALGRVRVFRSRRPSRRCDSRRWSETRTVERGGLR